MNKFLSLCTDRGQSPRYARTLFDPVPKSGSLFVVEAIQPDDIKLGRGENARRPE